MRGWPRKRLGEICEFIGGSQPPKVVFSKVQKSGYVRLIQIRDYKSDDHKVFIPRQRARRFCEPTDVMIGRYGPPVFQILRGLRGAYNVALMKALPDESQISKDFLFHFLTSPEIQRHVIDNSKRAAGQSGLNKETLEPFTLTLPPLSEQQRIVRILNEAFESIAKAKATAEKNLANSRALFESHLQCVFSQRGKQWTRLSLHSLLERGWIESHLDGNHGGDYPRKEEFISEGVPYISANCLENEQVDMSRAKYLSPTRASSLRKGIAKDKDVLFAHNATVGPVAILRTDQKKVILGTSLTYYRCNSKEILPEYLAHYMRSFEFKTQYLQVMRQSTRNQVPITTQREFFHVIPPLADQKVIIHELDGLFENGELLASIYRRKLTALEELKKSLLHQAFSGEL